MEFYLVVVLCLLVPALGQQCTLLEVNDVRLGNNMTEATEGLIYSAFEVQVQGVVIAVRIFETKVVCLAVGEVRDTYTFVSVVANYSCTSVSFVECNSAWTVSQFEFECDEALDPDMWVVGSATGIIITPADADFSSTTRMDCFRCAGNNTGIMFDPPPDDNHCVECPAECFVEGFMQCTNAISCCNYYDNNTCVESCTLPARPTDNNNCEVFCDALPSIENGNDIELSDDYDVGSVANYSCEVGYNLVGVVTRTCEVSNSTTFWSEMEPTCEIVDCGNLTDPSNGEVTFSNGTTFSSEADYSCNLQMGYRLMDEAQGTRLCQADGEWSGSEPSCVCGVAGFELEDGDCVESGGGGGLPPGAIAGIVIAAIVVVILVVAVAVGIGIYVRKTHQPKSKSASTVTPAVELDDKVPPGEPAKVPPGEPAAEVPQDEQK